MAGDVGVALRWLTAPEQVEQGTREELLACWRDVSNAGGAVGFPIPPAEVARSARDDLGSELLRLELRAGLGLEAFYGRLGWQVVGRRPGALRFSEHDRRDEVLMLLTLA